MATTTQTEWEPTVAYPEDKASVREDIFYNPYLAVLGTIPNAESAGKVRNIFNEARLASAENRIIWAAAWLGAIRV